jgi:DNA-binding transcriptional ArsR family regulator
VIDEGRAARAVYDAVADTTRRGLLDPLAQSGDLPPDALVALLPMGRTTVSRHLTLLKGAGLVKGRKVGRETRYRVNAYPLSEVHGYVCYDEQHWTRPVDHLRYLLKEAEA